MGRYYLLRYDKLRKDVIKVTEKEKILLFSYVYNNTLMLENEVKQLQSNIRFRRIDTADIFELLVAQLRLEMFKEISENILALINGHFNGVD